MQRHLVCPVTRSLKFIIVLPKIIALLISTLLQILLNIGVLLPIEECEPYLLLLIRGMAAVRVVLPSQVRLLGVITLPVGSSPIY